jgi:hypothetical protein
VLPAWLGKNGIARLNIPSLQGQEARRAAACEYSTACVSLACCVALTRCCSSQCYHKSEQLLHKPAKALSRPIWGYMSHLTEHQCAVAVDQQVDTLHHVQEHLVLFVPAVTYRSQFVNNNSGPVLFLLLLQGCPS